MPPETVEEPNYCFRRLERPLIPEFIQKDLSIFGNVVFVKRAALAAGALLSPAFRCSADLGECRSSECMSWTQPDDRSQRFLIDLLHLQGPFTAFLMIVLMNRNGTNLGVSMSFPCSAEIPKGTSVAGLY
jgi:hypothetical protein